MTRPAIRGSIFFRISALIPVVLEVRFVSSRAGVLAAENVAEDAVAVVDGIG